MKLRFASHVFRSAFHVLRSSSLVLLLSFLFIIPLTHAGGAKRVTGTSVKGRPFGSPLVRGMKPRTSTASNHGLKPLASDAVPVTSDDGEWYPFVLPEKLDPNSPMNIGKLVLDPPAGKHGFVKVKLVTGTKVPVTQVPSVLAKTFEPSSHSNFDSPGGWHWPDFNQPGNHGKNDDSHRFDFGDRHDQGFHHDGGHFTVNPEPVSSILFLFGAAPLAAAYLRKRKR